MHTWIVLSILAAALLLFVTEWLRVDIVALGVVVALALTGVLTAEQAFEGFSNPAVLTIAALFVIAGAATRSGVAATAARWILHFAGGDERRLLSLLMLGAALLSSVMSDTGTVAVMLPAVVALARRARIPTSRLLIPLSFGALLGGAATQIGTPPNWAWRLSSEARGSWSCLGHGCCQRVSLSLMANASRHPRSLSGDTACLKVSSGCVCARTPSWRGCALRMPPFPPPIR